jgi:hypothetical protein
LSSSSLTRMSGSIQTCPFRDWPVIPASARRFAIPGTAQNDAVCFIDHLMDEDNASNPRMPRIENLALFCLVGLVGVTAPRCTTASDRIRALTLGRRIAPISTTCRRSRQHEFRRRFWGVTLGGLRPSGVPPQKRHLTTETGRGSTYQGRKPVQTKPATSANQTKFLERPR